MAETTTVTLADFLLARVAEREERATRGAGGVITSYDGWHTVDCGTGLGYWADNACKCRYADELLTECEAKRLLVEEHTPGDVERGNRIEEECLGCGSQWPCLTLRLLALPYADHPSYDEEWRP